MDKWNVIKTQEEYLIKHKNKYFKNLYSMNRDLKLESIFLFLKGEHWACGDDKDELFSRSRQRGKICKSVARKDFRILEGASGRAKKFNCFGVLMKKSASENEGLN